MPTGGPVPNKDTEFNTYFLGVHAYLNAVGSDSSTINYIRLSISGAYMTALNNLHDEWNIIYPKSKSDSSRTKEITKQKDTLKKDITVLLRSIFGDIPKSALTISDRNQMNLKLRKKHNSAAPEPRTVPSISGKQSSGNTVLLYFRQQPHEDGSSRRGKPEHIARLEFVYKIEMPLATSTNDCTLTTTATRSPLKLHFNNSDAGKKISGFGRWINTRNIAGNWTTWPVVVVIP